MILSFAARVMLLALLLPLQACAAPLWYTAEPIQGNVVDAETGQPLEGVIITANWQLEGGIEGSYPVGQMMVMETVTDKDGRYRFPGWGPKHRPLTGRISTRAPQLLVFKSGYRYVGLANALLEKSLRGELDSPLRSDWDGKTVKLERFKGTADEYAHNVYDLNTAVKNVYSFPYDVREECLWKKIPRMITEIHKMSIYFDAKGVKLKGWRGGQHLDKISDLSSAPSCGSAVDFFRDHF